MRPPGPNLNCGHDTLTTEARTFPVRHVPADNRRPTLADPQNGAPTEDGISGLLREIRTVKLHSDNPRHRHFTNQNGHRPNNGYGQSYCRCGAKKFPSAPRCPTCAHEDGLIDRRTMQSLLNALSGEQPPSNYGSTKCQCGRNKLPSTSQCKPGAVGRGVLEISVEPGEEPCPNCGDGKKPAFTYCTGCAIAEGYIDQQGQVSPDCPMDECPYGNRKYAAYSRCSNFPKGITGYRHQDWTTGPNPVRILKPLPPATRPEMPTGAQTACHWPQNTPTVAEASAPAADHLPCWRCDRPTPAAKRFCTECLNEMGAPPEVYESDFNDRAEHEKLPLHMQGRG